MGVIDWLSLKIYQYELTFGLYMLNPGEKVAINALVLLFSFLFLYTTYQYVPTYASFAVERAKYYLLS